MPCHVIGILAVRAAPVTWAMSSRVAVAAVLVVALRAYYSVSFFRNASGCAANALAAM
jgi:hypothetical protein